jgi:two-component system CheB/CheR fusion protein
MLASSSGEGTIMASEAPATSPEHPAHEPAPVSESQPKARLPVVAVGAAARGLDTTREVLNHHGRSPGVAVVVVQHRVPTEDTRLVELLAHASEMPVTAAASGVVLEPDHVYVMPSDAELGVVAGRLELFERSPTGPHLPLDRLLESLASDASVHTIAVILSGAGNDGSAGAGAVVAGGGIVMAQDATAQFPQMPQRAVGLGYVDFVLPPAGLAREVLRLVQRRQGGKARGGAAREELGEVLNAVERATGTAFHGYRSSTVRPPVFRRMAVRGTAGTKDYAAVLSADVREAETLRENILLCVPSFFREPEVIQALKRLVFPRLLAKRAGKPGLRIWVPGTATGEEAYGLAIALHEYAAEHHETLPVFRIFGTDLSERAVAQARTGRFSTSVAREISPERLQNYFIKEVESYRIRGDVRDACVFATHDITRDPALSQIDLVSCRKVLSCLGEGLAQRVVASLRYSIGLGGFLLLDRGESVPEGSGFAAVDADHGLFVRAGTAPVGRPDAVLEAPGVARRRPGALRAVEAELEASNNERAVLTREMGRRSFESALVADDLANVLASAALRTLAADGSSVPCARI